MYGRMFILAVVFQEGTGGDMLSEIEVDMERNLTTPIQLLNEVDDEADEQEKRGMRIKPDGRALTVRLVAPPKEAYS